MERVKELLHVRLAKQTIWRYGTDPTNQRLRLASLDNTVASGGLMSQSTVPRPPALGMVCDRTLQATPLACLCRVLGPCSFLHSASGPKWWGVAFRAVPHRSGRDRTRSRRSCCFSFQASVALPSYGTSKLRKRCGL